MPEPNHIIICASTPDALASQATVLLRSGFTLYSGTWLLGELFCQTWLGPALRPIVDPNTAPALSNSMQQHDYNEILNIAKAQLARWRPKLSNRCYAALYAKCQHEWAAGDPTKPLDVFRGDQMYSFIANWKP